MKWLLWKDYRHNQLIVFTGLFLLAVPYMIGLCAVCREMYIWDYSLDHPAMRWKSLFACSSIYSLFLAQLTIALIGGNAIAGERVDRSAEFLAALPITRRKNLASKLLLALVIIGTIWLTAGVAFLCTGDCMEPGLEHEFVRDVLANTAIVALAFFCVAWFLSSFLPSAAIAVCGGLVTPLIAATGPYFVVFLLGYPDNVINYTRCFQVICLTLSPICFVIGTWHYLQRVEP